MPLTPSEPPPPCSPSKPLVHHQVPIKPFPVDFVPSSRSCGLQGFSLCLAGTKGHWSCQGPQGGHLGTNQHVAGLSPPPPPSRPWGS